MMNVKIGKKMLGKEKGCFVIAEAGVNHNGSLAMAKKLVDVAKRAGVDTVKFQIFKAENLVTKKTEMASYQKKNTGKKESQYDMLKKLELSYADFEKLKKYCDAKGIIFSATPHSSKEDVDLVAKLCPYIKVGSADLTNLPMLVYMAKKKLPMIVSTGMGTMQEIKEAVDTILPINKKLILLHCTTNYPAAFDEINLRAMATMEKEFGLPVGYSDHTEGIAISLAAAAMGACVIEKHFTLDKNLPGPDHKASLDPNELGVLMSGIRSIESALGNGVKKPLASELVIAKIARKSLVAGVDISKGVKITKEMIAIKRPGTGLAPKFMGKVIGKKTKKEIAKDAMIQLKDLMT